MSDTNIHLPFFLNKNQKSLNKNHPNIEIFGIIGFVVFSFFLSPLRLISLMVNWWMTGGGNSNIFFPALPGEMIQFDYTIFFKRVGSTTN